MAADRPTIVVIGAGFAGLRAVRALRRADARVVLIDRKNHHTFQPLLYQVASAALSPADITAPIRRIIRDQANAEVVLGEVRGIDRRSRRVHLSESGIAYDYLVIATGVTHSYFGNDGWALHAPGLKTIEDALEIRRRVLSAFEAAEMESDRDACRDALTFVVVGAGPTGVEMAGALAEIALKVVRRDYRNVDTASARVILIEAGDRVLPGFDPACSRRALDQLRQLGVSVWLGRPVTSIDETGVQLGAERLKSRTVIWAAGVRASSLGAHLGAPLDSGGRVLVQPDLTLPGDDRVYVVGDLASLTDAAGRRVPGIAPAALQMGWYAGRRIAVRIRGVPAETSPFRYVDKGVLATIGRHRATGVIFGRRVHGPLAWLLWAGVHVFYLIGFRNRVLVMIQWAWNYFMHQRGARLITGDSLPRIARPRWADEARQ